MLILAILFMCVVAAIGLACAINYFLKPGPWRSLGYACFAICCFLLFAASGLWDEAARHDWGILTPVFATMLIGGFFCLKFGKKAWLWWQKNEKKHADTDKFQF